MENVDFAKLEKAAELLRENCVSYVGAGDYVGVSRQAIDHYLRTGLLRAIRVERAVFIPKAQLDSLKVNPNMQHSKGVPKPVKSVGKKPAARKKPAEEKVDKSAA